VVGGKQARISNMAFKKREKKMEKNDLETHARTKGILRVSDHLFFTARHTPTSEFRKPENENRNKGKRK